MTMEKTQRRIDEIKAELAEMGPMHPGSISEQYNICGTPGCRCKDPKRPRKHGPYYQLSYTWRGRSSTKFIRPDQLEGMRGKVAHYKRFRHLIQEWVDLELQRERLERSREKGTDGD